MTNKNQIGKYIRQAIKLGALDAKQVSTKTIITAPWVRIKCQYGCSGYGKRLTCPPYSKLPEETERMLKDYQNAILIHGDDHTDVTRIAAKLERKIFLDGYYKAFAMGSGPCRLCDECTPEEGECIYPEMARPSMEACGIDVFKSARNNGYPIEVVKNENCEQNYYSIVLIE